MSYQIYDVNGFASDLSTTLGLQEYTDWAETLNDPMLNSFIEEGTTETPALLAEVLDEYDPDDADVASVHENLINALRKCNGIAIISDGLNDDL